MRKISIAVIIALLPALVVMASRRSYAIWPEAPRPRRRKSRSRSRLPE